MLASLDEATGVLLPRHVPPEHAVIVQVLLPVDVGAHPAKIHAVHQMKKRVLGATVLMGARAPLSVLHWSLRLPQAWPSVYYLNLQERSAKSERQEPLTKAAGLLAHSEDLTLLLLKTEDDGQLVPFVPRG